ncbi:hypothetical protein LDENG_00022090 [Lucifuga dentata]|nr:hypothetical protein LDENG_00022090 [Lucifuga dentata]
MINFFIPDALQKASSSSSTMATKPGAVTTATGGAAGSGVKAGGGASVGGAGKETPKAKPETAPVSQVKGTASSPAAGAAATAAAGSAAAVTKPKESPKDTAKSTTTTTTVKADVHKVDPAKVSKPAAAAMTMAGKVAVKGKMEEAKLAETKVQVEVPCEPKGAKQAALDDLASLLPPSEPSAPQQSIYTGPEVKERDVTSEKAAKCGERDDTLPPGYRFEDMAPGPADFKPKDVPKPLSTDEALDCLSSGFLTPAPQKEEKLDKTDSVTASFAVASVFAPPPTASAKTAEASAASAVQVPVVTPSAPPEQKACKAAPPVSVCPSPPADKKAKMEKAEDNFSLEAGLCFLKEVEITPVNVSPAPPADKKAKLEKSDAVSSEKETQKPQTAEGDSMSLDALNKLADILPAPEPKPEPPKLKPEDIVSEKKLKKEKGVRVGEREDTIPPEYRFPKDQLKDLPASKPEPTMDTSEALDFLSGGFETSPVAPAVQAPVVTPCALPAQKAEACKAAPAVAVCPAPPADKKAKMEKAAADLSLEAAPPKKTEATAPPADKKAKMEKCARQDTLPKTDEGDSMSLDALGTLAPEPKPEPPKLKPEDTVSEEKLKKEKGVRVGEREDTIPPEYRFPKDQLKDLPASKPEPTMDTSEALDFLSGGFETSSVAPAVQAPVVTPCALPAQKAEACKAAPAVAVCPAPPADKKAKMEKAAADLSLEAAPPKKTEATAPPADKKAKMEKCARQDTLPKTDEGDSMSLDALGTLGDTLAAPEPKPEPPTLKPEDIVAEEKLKKEKGVRVGEREDTIPPEYRFTEDQLKDLPAPKPEPTMGTGEALDILSGDFLSSSSAPVVQACVCTPSAPPTQCDPMPGPEQLSALDKLSGEFVCPTVDTGVQAICPAVPPTKKPSESDSMSLDALSALGDSLAAPEPKPESPKLRPEDIISEGKLESEEAVLVGEREDTLPPDFRFTTEDKCKDLPAPKPEPSMGTGEALDFLSGDLASSSTASAVQAAVVPSAPPAPCSADSALDALAGDFVAPAVAPVVECAASDPTESSSQQPSGTADALEALSDTLKDITPAPIPAPLPPKDIVKEKTIVEERLIKMGERDDTLPPEYRTTEEDLKAMADAKAKEAAKPKEKPMDDAAALAVLSSDFSAAPKPAAPDASPCKPELVPPVLDSEPLKPMPGKVLDSLSSTLLPEAPVFKPKEDKPKGKSKSKSKNIKQKTRLPLTSSLLSRAQTSCQHLVRREARDRLCGCRCNSSSQPQGNITEGAALWIMDLFF